MQNRCNSAVHSGSWIFFLYSEPLCTRQEGDVRNSGKKVDRFFLCYYGVSQRRSVIVKDKKIYCRQLTLYFTHRCSEVLLSFSKIVCVCVCVCVYDWVYIITKL